MPSTSAGSNPNFEIARMLSDLKADIAALRTETAIRRPEESKAEEVEREASSPAGSGAESQGVQDLLAGLEKDLKAAVREEDGDSHTGAADRLGALFSQLQKELGKVAGPVKAAEAGAGKLPGDDATPSGPEEGGEGAARAGGGALH